MFKTRLGDLVVNSRLIIIRTVEQNNIFWAVHEQFTNKIGRENNSRFFGLIMKNILSIFGLFLCVCLSTTSSTHIFAVNCNNPNYYCIDKIYCINGRVDVSASRGINHRSNRCRPEQECCYYEQQVRELISETDTHRPLKIVKRVYTLSLSVCLWSQISLITI